MTMASNLAKKSGYDVQKMDIVMDDTNSEWNRFLASGPHEGAMKPMLRNLEGHDYWAIMFVPKQPQGGVLVGGDITVFVDKKTGKVLTYVCGQ